MKNFNMILTEKQKKYQHYNLEKLINMNEYLTGEKILPNQRQIIEQDNFVYSALRKALEKQNRLVL